jgi:hypothetical protein
MACRAASLTPRAADRTTPCSRHLPIIISAKAVLYRLSCHVAMTKWVRILVALGFSALLGAISWTNVSGAPTAWFPMNGVVLLPGLIVLDAVGSTGAMIVATSVIPILFCAWYVPLLLQGSPSPPFRSLILLASAIALSAIWLIFGYTYGIAYQGQAYVATVSTISIGWWGALGTLAYSAWRYPTAKAKPIFSRGGLPVARMVRLALSR